MARLHSGILGGFSGKVGTVIGYIRNGVACMRGLATSYTDANSLSQQTQRIKWTIIVQFLRSLATVLRIGFSNVTGGMTAFNAALSYNLKNAISGIYPDFSVDYTKVKVSAGNLTGALNPEVISTAPGAIVFSWDNNVGTGDASADDEAILVMYNPIKLNSTTDLTGTTRAAGTKSAIVPLAWSDDEVQCYMFFKNAAGKMSESDAVGSCIVA